MIGLTSNSRNVHRVVDDNNNRYRSMLINAMRMNHGYVSKCSIVNEEPNAGATRFFEVLKDSDKSLWGGCTNHSKLSIVA
jgi:hypothetical protein